MFFAISLPRTLELTSLFLRWIIKEKLFPLFLSHVHTDMIQEGLSQWKAQNSVNVGWRFKC